MLASSIYADSSIAGWAQSALGACRALLALICEGWFSVCGFSPAVHCWRCFSSPSGVAIPSAAPSNKFAFTSADSSAADHLSTSRWRAVERTHRLLEIIGKRWPAETTGGPRS